MPDEDLAPLNSSSCHLIWAKECSHAGCEEELPIFIAAPSTPPSHALLSATFSHSYQVTLHGLVQNVSKQEVRNLALLVKPLQIDHAQPRP